MTTEGWHFKQTNLSHKCNIFEHRKLNLTLIWRLSIKRDTLKCKAFKLMFRSPQSLLVMLLGSFFAWRSNSATALNKHGAGVLKKKIELSRVTNRCHCHDLKESVFNYFHSGEKRSELLWMKKLTIFIGCRYSLKPLLHVKCTLWLPKSHASNLVLVIRFN